MTGFTRQRGVALITVLLVMVIAIAAVTHAVTRNRLAISRTSALLANAQLAEFVRGAEAWAVIALEKDFQEDAKNSGSSDNLAEAWAQRLVEFNPDNGKIRIQIRDLHACFNVNNLTLGGSEGGADAGRGDDVDGKGTVDNSHPAVLRRLVRNLGVSADLALAIQDWVDPGDIPLAAGTEDSGYLGANIAHRTPDTLITDVSELRAVQGMEAKDWSLLEPLLCALPEAGTGININTAPEALLQALLPAANVAGLVAQREAGTPFAEPGDLAAFGVTAGNTGFTFDSTYFVAHIAVQLGFEHRQYWESILRLDSASGKVDVIQRQRRAFSGQLLQELLGD